MLSQMTEFLSFSWLNNAHMYIFFIYLSVNGDLDCFYILAIMNSDFSIFLYLLISSYLGLGLVNLPVPQFPHLSIHNNNNSTY